MHVLTDSKQVVQAGSLTRRPVAFRNLEDKRKEKRETPSKRGKTAMMKEKIEAKRAESKLSQKGSVFHRDPR